MHRPCEHPESIRSLLCGESKRRPSHQQENKELAALRCCYCMTLVSCNKGRHHSGAYSMDPQPQRTRRDFVKAMSSALGGVSLLASGTARGQAIGSLPSGYKFYRVLTANQGSGGGIPTNIVNMNGSVMMASPASGSGPAYIYLHGQVAGGLPALFRIDIDYGSTPPRVTSAQSIATENSTINIDGIPLRIEHIGTGDSNSLGQYVTTLLPVGATPNTAPGVFLFTPGS